MSIDGIGKPGGPPGPGAPGATGPAGTGTSQKVGRDFQAELRPSGPVPDASGVAAEGAAPAAPGSPELQRLQAGEITLDGYLEARVEAATRHLAALPAEQLDVVRSTLRDQLRADPNLRELVRRATGVTPELP